MSLLGVAWAPRLEAERARLEAQRRRAEQVEMEIGVLRAEQAWLVAANREAGQMRKRLEAEERRKQQGPGEDRP
jgi:hypothetical protein